MLVAGEASGDLHAAAVVQALRQRIPDVEVFGMGGQAMRAAGVETVIDSEKYGSIVGISEVLKHLGTIRHALKSLTSMAKKRKPDVLVVVDFPDFNFRLIKRIENKSMKVVYFICPQLWAWRKGRIKFMKRYIDRVAAIFPFEEHFYHANGVEAEFVGHPFGDRASPSPGIRQELGVHPDAVVVALLPGSRKSEIQNLLPDYLNAFALVAVRRPGVRAVLPLAPGVSRAWIEEFIAASNAPPGSVAIVDGRAQEVLQTADVGLIASGTATVEAAFAGLPTVVAYRLSSVSYAIGRALIRGVKFIAMPNIIAGKKVFEEVLQDDVTPERLALELEILVGDPGRRLKIKQELIRVRRKLIIDPGNQNLVKRSKKSLRERHEALSAPATASSEERKSVGDRVSKIIEELLA